MKGYIYSYFHYNKIPMWYIHALVLTNIFRAWDMLIQKRIPSLYRFLPAIRIQRQLRLGVIPLLAIWSQHFCTNHESTAVVLCIKFRSDHCIRIEVRVKRNFHRICIAMKKVSETGLIPCILKAARSLVVQACEVSKQRDLTFKPVYFLKFTGGSSKALQRLFSNFKSIRTF